MELYSLGETFVFGYQPVGTNRLVPTGYMTAVATAEISAVATQTFPELPGADPDVHSLRLPPELSPDIFSTLLGTSHAEP